MVSRMANFWKQPKATVSTYLLRGDQTLYYEQNLAGRRLAIVALSSIEWRIIETHLAVIVRAVDSAIPGSFQAVDCGRFRRTKPREE